MPMRLCADFSATNVTPLNVFNASIRSSQAFVQTEPFGACVN